MNIKSARQYETMEFCLDGPPPAGSQVEIDLRAMIGPEGEEPIEVKGFYAGEGQYKLRYLPERSGPYHYTVCSESLGIKEEGTVTAEPAAQGRHGPVRPRGTAMYYADGGWFASFGTTVYALAHQREDLIRETLESLAASPFNKLRTCVFPKHYKYNMNNPAWYPFCVKEGREVQDFPGEAYSTYPIHAEERDDYWDTAHPCFAFWDHFESVLRQLDEMGVQVDLILFHGYDRWGFSNLSMEDNLRYLDYLLRRLSAFPNLWWSLANEYDLCFNKTAEDFQVFARYIHENDPFRHPTSNHNCFKFWDAGDETISHVSWQTKELTRVAERLAQYGKPVFIDECRYEGNVPEFWGNLSGQEMTRSFWRVAAQGGYCTHGETFLPGTEKGDVATRTGEKDVVWWAKGGRLNGESPARIAFLREVVESLPGPLEPLCTGFSNLADLDDETIKTVIAQSPPFLQDFMNRIAAMNQVERQRFYAVEYTYEGHCGQEAFLYYLDDQCAASYAVTLPEERRYRVELLDTWAMQRQTVLEDAAGTVEIKLPGRPYMAILAIAEQS